MIFFLWYSVWLLSASGVAAFIIPYLAFIARTTYFQGRIRFLKMSHLMVAITLFIWLLLVSTNPLESTLSFAFRVIGFMALTFHFSTRLSDIPWHKAPHSIGVIWFIASRFFPMVMERRKEFEYAIHLRIAHRSLSQGKLLLHRVTLTLKALIANIADMVLLVRQLNMIINARGGLPHIGKWQISAHAQVSLASMICADIVLICLVWICLYVTPDSLVPYNLAVIGHGMRELLTKTLSILP